MDDRYLKIINNNLSDKNSGFILIDKERDWTSFDVVAKLRTITKIKKIGHAGTLDPFATGLLVVAIGKATKLLDLLIGQNKTYQATMILGQESDTYDITGKISTSSNTKIFSQEEIKTVLTKFIGRQEQIPPMFSAKKLNGKKLYELARQGIEVERKAKSINIYSLVLEKYDFPRVTFSVNCSTGTYIRSLAHDLGRSLGCGALLEDLRRTSVAGIDVSWATTIGVLTEDWRDKLLPLDEMSKWIETNTDLPII